MVRRSRKQRGGGTMDQTLQKTLLDESEQSIRTLKTLLDGSDDLTTLLAGKTTSGKSVLSILFKIQDKGGLFSSKPQICLLSGSPAFLVSEKKYILLRLYGASTDDAAFLDARRDCGIDSRYFENLDYLTELILALYKLNDEEYTLSSIDSLVENFNNYINTKTEFTKNNNVLIEFFKNLDRDEGQYFDSTAIRRKHPELYDVVRPTFFPGNSNVQAFISDERNSDNTGDKLRSVFKLPKRASSTYKMPAETEQSRKLATMLAAAQMKHNAYNRARQQVYIDEKAEEEAIERSMQAEFDRREAARKAAGGARRTRKPRRKAKKTRRSRH